MRCPVWCPQKQASSMQVLQRPQPVCECFLNSRCLRHEDCHEDCNPSDCFLVNVPTHLTLISRRLVSCLVQLRVWFPPGDLAGLCHIAGQDVDSMIAVAKAYKERSLQGFQAALAAYRAQLVEDPIVHAHLSQLYDTLLEGNLARLIEPFSCVEISHLAELIKLPQDLVLNKLSQVGAHAPRRPRQAVLPRAE